MCPSFDGIPDRKIVSVESWPPYELIDASLPLLLHLLRPVSALHSLPPAFPEEEQEGGREGGGFISRKGGNTLVS